MLTLVPGRVTLAELRRIAREPTLSIALAAGSRPRIEACAAIVERIVASGKPAYGINTGFGKLAQTHIPNDQLESLQRNLILSHSAGVGAPLPDDVVRLILALKIASLAQGYSGVRPVLVDALVALFNAGVCPRIPSKGSVGASGDLAPLAHMSAVLLGLGQVTAPAVDCGDDDYDHGDGDGDKGGDGGRRTIDALDGLALAGLAPITLKPKEGLALINGTQVSTALALRNLFGAEDLFAAAVVAGAMSVDAAMGSDVPFDPRIHALRGHRGQADVAGAYRVLLDGSAIRHSHLQGDDKVQDPYSLRCQPQVMGACLDILRAEAATLLVEANGVTDNPLIFPSENGIGDNKNPSGGEGVGGSRNSGGGANDAGGDVLSGGNFHAEPVAFAADHLALAIAEIGGLSERRTALLVDPGLSGLPPFLVEEPGLNSGYMIAQVTAAALAAENKCLSHPASVDSLPTSANQEDHVSMATHAARRLGDMVENSMNIVAIELLAAAQGIDFRAPLKTSPRLAVHHARVRFRAAFFDHDRLIAPDIDAVAALIREGAFRDECAGLFSTER